MKKIFIAGHRGMVGSAVIRGLTARDGVKLLTRTRSELDLCDQAAVEAFFMKEKPDVVIHCAARVGGIHANNTYPAEFIQENLAMSLNVIHSAYRNGVSRLLYLGSSCIYPREAPQPLKEDYLLTGPLEKTNEAYALAKIAGLKLCEHYRSQYGVCFHSAMPTNLYGTGDNYHPEHSHVIPGLIRRFHEAKEAKAPSVTLWGSGTPLREFLHVEDLASGLLTLLDLEDPPDIVNIGSGEEVTIRELAELVKSAVGYRGELLQDPSKPDGTPRKLLDSSRMRSCGWAPSISLTEGLKQTYREFSGNEQYRSF
jgi:GDP-L-fucose synthase